MAPPWDVFGVGCAVGGAAGIALGYQMRKLVVRVSDWRRDRALIKRRNEFKRQQKEDVEHDDARELPPIIPIEKKRGRRATSKTPQPIPIVRDEHELPHWSKSVNPDREDVLAALTGAGYSKAEAIAAADACTLVERAHGLESWTRAAFNNAHRSKS